MYVMYFLILVDVGVRWASDNLLPMVPRPERSGTKNAEPGVEPVGPGPTKGMIVDRRGGAAMTVETSMGSIHDDNGYGWTVREPGR